MLPELYPDFEPDLDGPTDADLAAIEAEGPLREAEMDLVAAEIRVLTAEPRPSALDWRRLRRAERRVSREAAALASRSVNSAGPPKRVA
jgi:hypothetical protein